MRVLTDTSPYWSSSADVPSFTNLVNDIHADVVIIGGGITGLTAAYLLSAAGKSVVVLERERCAMADTGHTSAHLTMVTDARVSELVARLGPTHAQAVWDAGLAAIARIDSVVREHRMDAGFEWVDGYLHVPVDGNTSEQAKALQADAALAASLGFDAGTLEKVPFIGVPGIRFDGQARIHPRKYLAGIAKVITERGSRIYEHTEASEFVENPLGLKANGHTVTCDDIVVATHNPLAGISAPAASAHFQTKLALYASYVIAGRVVKGTVPDALWWDTANPYRYLRIEPQGDHDVVMLGGEDHKTGQEADTLACFERLEARLTRMLPGVELTHRWSGQVIETPDGLPYIGRSAEHQYSATGYSGNGLTFGTLAGMMISDTILGRTNPWADLFDPARKALGRGLWEYVTENADYPYYRIRDRFAGADGKSLRALKRGQGQIIEHKGEKAAAYRDPSGAVTIRSATCPHMGCIVAWNSAERTWDCPCHGSRFKPTGQVISGPAQSPLPEVK